MSVVAVEDTVDKVGAGLLALTLGAIGVHALGTAVWRRERDRRFPETSPSVPRSTEPRPPAYPDLAAEDEARREQSEGRTEGQEEA